jgi:hypothetical protein
MSPLRSFWTRSMMVTVSSARGRCQSEG